jgi:2-hydroxy-6-oxonona-2,4-dienedioate hydrolase
MPHGILPVSQRAEGLLYDSRLAADPPTSDLSSITAPALALPPEAARHIGDTGPGARNRIYAEGGHILICHFPRALSEIDRFLRAAP